MNSSDCLPPPPPPPAGPVTVGDVSGATIAGGSIIFLVTWIFMARKIPYLPIGRTAGTMCGAVCVVVFGILGTDEAYTAINFETLSLLFGTMVMTILLEREGFFALMIRVLSWRCRTGTNLLIRVCVVTGVLAALVTNDTVCVFLTPIVCEMCAKHKLPFGPYLIALATSANIGSTLTPVGNPQNMIIASLSGIRYLTFVGRIGLSTLVGMLINIGLLLYIYRKQLKGLTLEMGDSRGGSAVPSVVGNGDDPHADPPSTHRPSTALPTHDELDAVSSATAPAAATAVAADGNAAAAADDTKSSSAVIELSVPATTAAGAASAAAATLAATATPAKDSALADRDAAIIIDKSKTRRKLYAFLVVLAGTIIAFMAGANLGWTAVASACLMLCIDFEEPDRTFREVDWGLLVFFSSLFIVVHGFQLTGIPASVWNAARPAVILDQFSGVTLYAVLIVIGSNTVSNVPLVLLLSTSIPLLPDPRAGWLLLSFISTVAGNFTLIGSVANLIVCERAKKWYQLTFMEYLWFGFPSTLLVTFVGTLLLRATLFI